MLRIITDSSCDICPNFVKNNNIIVVPMEITIDDKIYKDGIDLDKSTFYEKLKSCKELPKTSLINQARWQELIDNLNDNDEYIILPIASGLSGTYDCLRLAVNESNKSNISVIESSQVTIGLGLIVKLAQNKINSGATRAEVVEYIESIKNNVVVYGMLDTLKYLKAGGRISTAKAIIGEMLDIKPVLQVKNGVIDQHTKVRGTKAGRKVLLSKIVSNCKDNNYTLGHGNNTQFASEFQELIKSNTDLPIVDVDIIGCTIGTHLGPNSLLIAVIEE